MKNKININTKISSGFASEIFRPAVRVIEDEDRKLCLSTKGKDIYGKPLGCPLKSKWK